MLLATGAVVARRDDKVLTNDDRRLSDCDNGDREMSSVEQAQSLMREAWPLSRYGSVKAIYYECQRFMSRRTEREFTQRRARTIWEGRATRIYSDEMDALRAAKIEEMKHEQKAIRARLDQIDQALAGWRADVGRGSSPEGRP